MAKQCTTAAEREARVAASQERVRQREAQRKADRLDRLKELYYTEPQTLDEARATNAEISYLLRNPHAPVPASAEQLAAFAAGRAADAEHDKRLREREAAREAVADFISRIMVQGGSKLRVQAHVSTSRSRQNQAEKQRRYSILQQAECQSIARSRSYVITRHAFTDDRGQD